jgi:hypothetical protein
VDRVRLAHAQARATLRRAFPEEFAEHLEGHGCPRPGPRPIPKLIDLARGVAIYDERFWSKRPDWTYGD